ncbi:MAG: sulfotransferase [Acidimicrobiia bacterium]|nr:sulfotransferase [Acidimicrobiia bacterium]
MAQPPAPQTASPDSTRFFIGIGAEKAGTSWLDRRLREHPQVWMPPHKEIHYFDQLYLDLGPRIRRVKYGRLQKEIAAATADDLADPVILARLRWFAAQGLVHTMDDEWYLGLFAEARRTHPVVGEITPAYAVIGEQGFRHMARLLPGVRIIFLMRHPVDRLWSAIRYYASRRPEANVMASPQRTIQHALSPLGLGLAKGRYHDTLTDLARMFDPEQLLYAFYEDIFASEESQLAFLRRMCAFLGVDYSAATFIGVTQTVNATPPRPMPVEVEQALSAALAPVVDEVERMLGRVPESWRSPAAAREPLSDPAM